MHHIVWGEAFEQTAHEPEFAAAFAAVWPHPQIKRRASYQANHHDQSCQRKTDPGAWVLGWAGLGWAGLGWAGLGWG